MKREREDGVAAGVERRIRAQRRNKMELYEIFSIPSRPPPGSKDFFSYPASSRQGRDHGRVAISKSMPTKELLNLGYMKMPSATENPQPQSEKATAPSIISSLDETKSVGKSEDPRSSCDESIKETFSNQMSGSADDCSIVDADESISPDNLVGLIGTKYFWKLRKAIADQQRVFKFQVFELHRLMKVQELLSGSPDVIVEDFTPLKASEEEDLSESAPLPWFLRSPAEGPQKISADQISTGSEVDQLRVDSWSLRDMEMAKNRPFSNCASSGSNPQVERDCWSSLPRVHPLEFPGRLTYLPRASPPSVSQEGSVPWTPLPRVSFTGDSGSSTTLKGSRIFTPLPMISPPEDFDPPTNLPEVNPKVDDDLMWIDKYDVARKKRI